ncbi:MAG TPA: VOC family protein [Candidatus Baltobacteraceae bacterium]|nr:VOC family protein [Candidatus Baltobacteraceae bacterium]
MRRFEGFDHVDCRVRSLAAVETFYDRLMPELGLPNKRYAYVDEAGEWNEVSSEHAYNAVEYYERAPASETSSFMGFIEQPNHEPGLTRVAFRVERTRLFELESLLAQIGARQLERSEDIEAYPAVFFEDPTGTKLELVARGSSIA